MTTDMKRIIYLELFHFVPHSTGFKWCSALQGVQIWVWKEKKKYTFGNNGKFKSSQKNVTQIKYLWEENQKSVTRLPKRDRKNMRKQIQQIRSKHWSDIDTCKT